MVAGIITIIVILLIPFVIYIACLKVEGKDIKESFSSLPRKLMYGLLKIIVYASYVIVALGGLSYIKVLWEQPKKEWPLMLAIMAGCGVGEFILKLLDILIEKYIKPMKKERQE